jgi:uncharacterized protein (TIGR03000 family)
MKRSLFLAAAGVATVALTLATPAASQTPDNQTADYPLLNRLFDRWIDNRRAARDQFAPSYGGGVRQRYVETRQVAPVNTVTIHLAVPPDAKVWFNDQETKQTGSERFFESPPLTPGYDYTYAIKANWSGQDGREVTQTRQLIVRVNAAYRVDFMQPVR